MRRAIIYRYKRKTLVLSLSKTTDGVWILWGSVQQVADGSGTTELGQQVLLALEASREGVPHPRDWKAVQDPLLTLAGVKTVAAFNKSADCVEVEGADGQVTLIPMRNLGTRGGFEPDLSRKVTMGEHAARVGELVAAAFRAGASPLG